MIQFLVSEELREYNLRFKKERISAAQGSCDFPNVKTKRCQSFKRTVVTKKFVVFYQIQIHVSKIESSSGKKFIQLQNDPCLKKKKVQIESYTFSVGFCKGFAQRPKKK